jgi:RNA-directed DNA polymerase
MQINIKDKVNYHFHKMKDKNDFIKLLKLVSSILPELNIKKINILKFSDSSQNSKYYKELIILKKSGERRIISAPVSELKKIQKIISIIIQCVFVPNDSAFGFIWNKSISDNAIIHIEKNYVFNIDLKDFFSCIDDEMILKCLTNAPFYLNLKSQKNDIAILIASICCKQYETSKNSDLITENKNVLPQGAPSSPVLSNVVCYKLDILLNNLARCFNLTYSRYADDITFSSMHNVYQKDSDFIKELANIITSQGFQVNEKKTRLQKKCQRQSVTGLIVNTKVNIKQNYIKELRMWLYYWETYGYERANSFFIKKQKFKNEYSSKDNLNIKNTLKGKLDYLKMILGDNNSMYNKLKSRYIICLKK